MPVKQCPNCKVVCDQITLSTRKLLDNPFADMGIESEIRRRRIECIACHHRYTTVEVEYQELMVLLEEIKGLRSVVGELKKVFKSIGDSE